MSDHVSVRSNWTPADSLSLDLVCEVGFEEEEHSAVTDEQKEKNDVDDDDTHRAAASSDESVTSVTLQSDTTDEREDPVLTLTVRQPDAFQLLSIQLLSSARHLEFYHQEYIGTCQGSRITELDCESIYESNYEFHQSHSEVTVKCLKLADVSKLTIYCLQINLRRAKVKSEASSMSTMNLPFDLNRVRSMIDEGNLSSSARQFMNDLQHIEERRCTTVSAPPQGNMAQLMLMMKGMSASSSQAKPAPPPTSWTPLLNQLQTPHLNEEAKATLGFSNDSLKQELNAMETRLQAQLSTCFTQFQQHIDHRFDRLEEQLNRLESNLSRTDSRQS